MARAESTVPAMSSATPAKDAFSLGEKSTSKMPNMKSLHCILATDKIRWHRICFPQKIVLSRDAL
jgi:hypothetical protein